MTELERSRARAAYFKAYAKANKTKRALACKRWREKNRDAYNAMQRINNERLRRANGVQPRQPAKPKPAKAVKVAKPKPKIKAISVPREVPSLWDRFRAYLLTKRKSS